MSKRAKILVFAFLIILSARVHAQDSYSGYVKTMSGKQISFDHFGLLTCGGEAVEEGANRTFSLSVAGILDDQELSFDEYDNVKRITFHGFRDDPRPSTQLKSIDIGTLIVFTKDGGKFQIEQATIQNQCYGKDDEVNMIRFQGSHPITKKPDEVKLAVNKISEIYFN